MPANMNALEPVVEVLHGETVVDPYRWLEDRRLPATEAWIRDQRLRHDSYFAQIPGLDWLRRRVEELLNVDSLDQPARVGNRCFYRRRRVNQEQACICLREIDSGEERVLVDPRDQGPFASVAIHHISDDGSLLAYELRRGGSDAKTIHILTVEDGHTLPDRLEICYVRGFAFAPDGSGFYYCQEFAESTESHMVRFHRLGQNSDQDEVLFRADRSQQSRLGFLADELHLGAVLTRVDGSDTVIDLHVSRHSRNSKWTKVLTGRRALSGLVFSRGHIFVMTEEDTPRRRIVELSDDGTRWRTVVPESEYEIQRFAVAGNNIFVTYLVGRRPLIRRWTFAGEYIGTLELPEDGSIDLLPSFTTNPDSLFYVHESFTKPKSIQEFQPAAESHAEWPTSAEHVQRHVLQANSSQYRSKDGTKIPMTLVMRSDLDHRTTHPAVLTSYGGFGTSMTPRFSVLVTIFLELGAVFALPNVRGGSEFGKAWHEAAKVRKRQVAIDDFICAAEFLCEQGITATHKLAICGGSNSGLLVGAAMTQRPDLFRAVLCIAPLLDMIRYEHFDSARKWRHEYGTAADPQDFQALHAYSPYHQVREDVDYPSTLFVSGDKDDRCNPAHVRKMAALLQDRASQLNPILVDYSPERGHFPVLPLSVRIEALAKRIAFLCHQLGIEIPSEAVGESSFR